MSHIMSSNIHRNQYQKVTLKSQDISHDYDANTLKLMLADSRDGLVYRPSIWKNLIVDFTLSFLITNPTDLISFGLEYFENLRTKKYVMNEERSLSDEEEEEEGESHFPRAWAKVESKNKERRLSPSGLAGPPPRIRRKSVFSDPTDTDDDDESWVPAVHPKTDEQRRNCRERMKEVMLFREVSPEDLSALVDAMIFKEVEPGEKIITQGEDGDYFYIIDSGLYEAYFASNEGVKGIAKYNNHGTFGELALMYNVPRTCSVRALTRGGLWALERDTFKRIVVKGAKRKRTQYMNFLHKVPLLKNLTEYEMLNLADSFVRRTFNVGEAIVRQGDEADGMYFIEEGQVGVSRIDESGKEIGLQELEVGNYFGELALLEKQPRAATAYAMTDVKLAFLCAEAFERLLGSCRQVLERRASEYKKEMHVGKSISKPELEHEKPASSSILKRDKQETSAAASLRRSVYREGSHQNVKVKEPEEESEGAAESAKRRSTRRSSLSRRSTTTSRSSKFYDRKPSIFQMLPEVMQNSSVHE
uniref:cAMP-dependent protein kinase type II regulatory subunit n=1 Tax=Lygus hesperus TaxID=30085 RepID=A0A0A9XMM4_LYGHE